MKPFPNAWFMIGLLVLPTLVHFSSFRHGVVGPVVPTHFSGPIYGQDMSGRRDATRPGRFRIWWVG